MVFEKDDHPVPISNNMIQLENLRNGLPKLAENCLPEIAIMVLKVVMCVLQESNFHFGILTTLVGILHVRKYPTIVR